MPNSGTTTAMPIFRFYYFKLNTSELIPLLAGPTRLCRPIKRSFLRPKTHSWRVHRGGRIGAPPPCPAADQSIPASAPPRRPPASPSIPPSSPSDPAAPLVLLAAGTLLLLSSIDFFFRSTVASACNDRATLPQPARSRGLQCGFGVAEGGEVLRRPCSVRFSGSGRQGRAMCILVLH